MIFFLVFFAMPHSMGFSQELDLGLFKPSAMVSIESSKKELKSIYMDGGQNKTIHCGCMFDRQLQVHPAVCEHAPKGMGRGKARQIVKWIHLVPVSVFAGPLRCWNEAVCTRSGGSSEKGRDCCGEISPKFKSMHADMHNLFPSVAVGTGAEIDIFGGKEEYSLCTNTDSSTVEPRTGLRGEIARAYFYMSVQYRFPISEDLEDRLRMWHLKDPPNRWEEERNTSIEIVQGNRNPFIDRPELVERVQDF
jgi:deoxyribonuclease-1